MVMTPDEWAQMTPDERDQAFVAAIDRLRARNPELAAELDALRRTDSDRFSTFLRVNEELRREAGDDELADKIAMGRVLNAMTDDPNFFEALSEEE